MLTRPIAVYINWAAYDELSDNVELTEALAMRQLDELLRLRARGVQLDAYLMDAFWYAPDGGYRTWRTPHWPDGPDRWLERCQSHGVLPGLWVASNTMSKLEPLPAWEDSLSPSRRSACLFYGGFLPHFLETLDHWYRRGVRLYKFDFLDLAAAPEALRRTMLPSEIRAQNAAALRAGLAVFRQAHPDVVLLAYNGFDEVVHDPAVDGLYNAQTNTTLPYRRTVDLRWLEVFDSLYCGDPRPADVPAHNFWRAKDIYSDHMVRVYELNGMPLPRIDSSGFMIGTTGTCYYRGTAAWQGMLLLSLARGGWVNTYYGNLDLLDDAQAEWFARAQRLFLNLQAYGRIFSFGGLPGAAEPYGFAAEAPGGALYAVVNPAQRVADVRLPGVGDRVLFHDAGFVPELRGELVRLGPEQLALIGAGRIADADDVLGIQHEVRIPRSIEPVAAAPEGDARHVAATVAAPASGSLRLIARQRAAWGGAHRSSGGSPPDGVTLGRILTLAAEQGGRAVPIAVGYDKAIWSGLSWAVGEIAAAELQAGEPVTLRATTSEPAQVRLELELYHVEYA